MTRRQALRGARWVFVLLTLACAWWGFRGRWAEIGDAVAATGPARSAGAVVCAGAGLALTGVLWRRLLRGVGSEVAARDAAAVFFVGQLGKYVPGSVWSLAVQAQLGRRHGVPARSSVTASAVFLLVHTATGLLLGGLLVGGSLLLDGPAGDRVGEDLATAWPACAVVVGAVALAPPLLRRLAERLAGHAVVLGARELVPAVALMVAVWTLYGASTLLLVPGASAATPSLVGAVAAFALAHAVGVLVVFAPAGVGAREGVLVALLAPAVGVPAAAAVALLSRVAHAAADFSLAGAAALVGRTDTRSADPREPARAGGR
ncbi:lysylphosphatidylglycerol synthase domain-containing protein [Nocardioides sp. SYSU D00065]|uniref:lysylphosphatidylglycerol synthase domain-containing protein n=1 Tax=Nocardioides sp. SYSU D00065 TaxID=2817378 RepID=UPI001B3360F6|nr:lysylphosphatidylglycerol synthase domain-containing protein [Nocardioides sp. SYSU D00065]